MIAFAAAGLAICWGALLAAFDDPDARDKARIKRLSAVMLAVSAAVVAMGVADALLATSGIW